MTCQAIMNSIFKVTVHSAHLFVFFIKIAANEKNNKNCIKFPHLMKSFGEMFLFVLIYDGEKFQFRVYNCWILRAWDYFVVLYLNKCVNAQSLR